AFVLAGLTAEWIEGVASEGEELGERGGVTSSAGGGEACDPVGGSCVGLTIRNHKVERAPLEGDLDRSPVTDELVDRDGCLGGETKSTHDWRACALDDRAKAREG